jgi:hypothetical protein
MPQFSGEFSDTQSATLSILSGVVTVTATAHGLIAGDKFTLSGFALDEKINYSHTVATVTNANTFTFTIVQTFITASNQAGTLHKKIRIYSSASVQLSLDSYAKQSTGEFKKVLYVIDLGARTSKDRSVGSDATFEMLRATDFKMTMINSFGILAILPIKNDTVGATATDFARSLLVHFIAGIVGRQLPSDWADNQTSAIVPISSNRESSNNAFIAQNYTFEVSERIGVADINRDDFGYNITDFNTEVIPKIGD